MRHQTQVLDGGGDERWSSHLYMLLVIRIMSSGKEATTVSNILNVTDIHFTYGGRKFNFKS